jgi:PilZ domain
VATTNEFRRHPRISAPKGTILAWRSGFARQVSRIGNLSLGGLYIRTTEPPPTGAVIQLLLNVPAGEVRARAVVQWSEPMKGVGVKFVAMQQEDHARFASWLKQLSS